MLGKLILSSLRTNEYCKSLKNYLTKEKKLDGSSLQKDWFPPIPADIFLSHSHKDENLAITIAGWIFHNFGLTTFIDSCIWGYSDDLLKDIDIEYSKDFPSSSFFSYSKRNITTSNIHLMLSNALMKMIDETECLFFLNTANSITSIDDSITATKTDSPWIYTEINIANVIRTKKLSPIHRNKSNVEKYINESTMNFTYDANLLGLYSLNNQILNNWKETTFQYRNNINVLPISYDKYKHLINSLYLYQSDYDKRFIENIGNDIDNFILNDYLNYFGNFNVLSALENQFEYFDNEIDLDYFYELLQSIRHNKQQIKYKMTLDDLYDITIYKNTNI